MGRSIHLEWIKIRKRCTALVLYFHLQVILSLGTRLYLDHPYEPDPEEIGMYWATRYIDTNRVFNFMPDDIFANADVNKMGQPLDLDVLCQNNGCPKPTKPNNIIGKLLKVNSDQ